MPGCFEVVVSRELSRGVEGDVARVGAFAAHDVMDDAAAFGKASDFEPRELAPPERVEEIGREDRPVPFCLDPVALRRS